MLGHESLGRVLDPGPSGGLQEGRPGGRHRPPPRPGSLPELRGGRVGHVPQRPVHRARHQADRRLHVRALADRARVRHQGRPVAGHPRRAARADDRRRQGLGAGRGGRPARVLGAADRARDRRRARSACSRPSSAKQHGLDVHVLDRMESGAKPDLVRALGATYHSGSVADIGFEPDVIIECTGVGQVIADSIQAVGAGRRRLPDRRRARAARHRRPPCADVAAAAVLKNNVIVGSVNANKRHWYKAGAGAGPRRPGVAGPPDHAPRDARRTSRRRSSASRTTSRSSSSFPTSDRGQGDAFDAGPHATCGPRRPGDDVV